MVRSAALLQCTTCDKTFTRQERLLRHARSHTCEKPYQCTTCGKSFTRADTLTRHMSSHQQIGAPSRPPVSTRACTQCAKSRVRCSHSLPCVRCANKHLSCTYPASPSAPIPPLSGGELDVEGDGMDLDHLANHSDNNALPDQGVHLLDDTPEYADFSQRVLAMNWWSPGWQDIENWDAQQNALFTLQPPTGDGVGQLSVVPSSSFMGSNQNDSWPSSVAQNTIITEQHLAHLDSSHLDSAHTRPSVSSARVSRYYVDGEGVRAPLPGRYSGTAHSIGGSDSASQSQSSLSADQGFLSNESYLNTCQQLRSRVLLQSLETNQDPIPTVAEFRRYIQRYFEEFHSSIPFIHKASFRSMPTHWVLVLAITIVGSQYAKYRPHTHLHGLLGSVLREYTQAPLWNEDTRQMPYDINGNESSHNRLQLLQAGVLNTLLMLLSSSQVHINKVAMEISNLVAMCEDLELFKSETIDHEIPASVNEWIYAESKLRTGLAIWLLDTIISSLMEKPYQMVLTDHTTRLPSPRHIWDDTPDQTSALSGRSTLTIMDALEILYMEKKLPTADEFCATLLIQGIHRKSREVLTQSQSQLHAWIPHALPQARKPNRVFQDTWPPPSPLYMKWRNSACDCLDILHWSANSNIAKSAGWEDPVVLHLHLARILLLTPVAHLQRLAADPIVLRGRRLSVNEEDVRSRWVSTQKLLRQWVARDQYKARLSLVHAGAIFWHVRRYSVKSFVEPYAIYAATLILWAYSIVAQSNGAPHNFTAQELEIRSDRPEAEDSLDQETDYEPLIIYIDRPCDDEMVQKYARIGPKMTASMRRVGSITASGAPKRIILEGMRLLRGEAQVSGAQQPVPEKWEVSQIYAQSLVRLEALAVDTGTWNHSQDV